MKQYDTVVIGGGPAGMSAALYMARFGVSLAFIEKTTPGGLILQTAEIENYPGVKKIEGYALVDAMVAQLADYTFDRYAGEVTAIEPEKGKNRILVNDEWIEARSIIISSGVQYRKLGLPHENELIGKGISYCALCDGNFFRGQVVGVVGGGNSALEEALYLSRIAKELHIFHRRDEFRADKIYQDKIKNTSNIHLHMSTVISGLRGEDVLSGVEVCSTRDNSIDFCALDGLFIFTGFVPCSAMLPKALSLDTSGFILTDAEMRTNLPGIFAAGDIRAKLCRQVATAVGDGATAANAAHAYLEQENV